MIRALLDHRGLQISLGLSGLLLIVVWAVQGTVANVERYWPAPRPATVEQRQAEVDRCIQRYTADCGPVGPPGPDGRDDRGAPGTGADGLDGCSRCGDRPVLLWSPSADPDPGPRLR